MSRPARAGHDVASNNSPTTNLRPGDEAIVTDGLCKDMRGVIRGAGDPFGTIPTLRIEFSMPLGVRQIRADFLRRAS